MNRFERVAKQITDRHGVHVEWVPAKREYVIDGGHQCGDARKADRKARDVAAAANRSIGYLPPSSVR